MEQRQFGFLQYVKMVWRQKWLVLVVVVVATVGGFMMRSRPVPPVPHYVATATIMVQPTSAPSSVSDLISSQSTADRSLQTQMQLMQSNSVLQQALAILNGSNVGGQSASSTNAASGFGAAEIEALQSSIEISPVSGTNLVKVTATARDPKTAQDRANAIVTAYQDSIREDQQKSVRDALASVQHDIQTAEQGFGQPTVGNPDALIAVRRLVASAVQSTDGAVALLTNLAATQSSTDPLGGQASDLSRSVSGAANSLNLASARLAQLVAQMTAQQSSQSQQASDAARAIAQIEQAISVMQAVASGPLRSQSTADPQAIVSSMNVARQRLDALTSELQQTLNQSGNGATPSSAGSEALSTAARSTATGLRAIAGTLASLRGSGTAVSTPSTTGVGPSPQTFQQLLLAETELNAGADTLGTAANLLPTAASIPGGALLSNLQLIANQIATVQGQLNAELAQLKSVGSAPSIAQGSSGGQLFQTLANDLNSVNLSVDVVRRQLATAASSATDSSASAELSAIGSVVSSVHSQLGTSIGQATNLGLAAASEISSPSNSRGVVSTVSEMLAPAIADLKTVDSTLQSASAGNNDASVTAALKSVPLQLQAAQTILGNAVSQLQSSTGSSQTPANQALNVATAAGKLGDGQNQLSQASAILKTVTTSQGPTIQSLVAKQQELQLLLLNPQPTGISVVDPANESNVSAVVTASKSRSILRGMDPKVAMAGIGGLILGVLGALIIELRNRRLRDDEDVRNAIGIVPSGGIPRQKGKWRTRPPMLSGGGASLFGEAVKNLATVIETNAHETKKVLLISSPKPGDGKTTIALNLAATFARRGREVLVIDANFRKPDLTGAIDLRQYDGLADLLRSEKSLRSVIHRFDGFFALPAGHAGADETDLLFSSGFQSLLERAAGDFDQVIVDGPPLVGFAESGALARVTQQVVMVLRSGVRSERDAKAAVEIVTASGADVVGTVMNFATPGSLKHLRHRGYDRANALVKSNVPRPRTTRRTFFPNNQGRDAATRPTTLTPNDGMSGTSGNPASAIGGQD